MNRLIFYFLLIVKHFTHFITGLLAGFVLDYDPLFSIMLTFLFVLYEYSERKVVRDKMFPEIAEYTIGFVFGWDTSIPFIDYFSYNEFSKDPTSKFWAVEEISSFFIRIKINLV